MSSPRALCPISHSVLQCLCMCLCSCTIRKPLLLSDYPQFAHAVSIIFSPRTLHSVLQWLCVRMCTCTMTTTISIQLVFPSTYFLCFAVSLHGRSVLGGTYDAHVLVHKQGCMNLGDHHFYLTKSLHLFLCSSVS